MLAHANTSGFDLTNHADDLYLFLSAADHAEGLAGTMGAALSPCTLSFCPDRDAPK